MQSDDARRENAALRKRIATFHATIHEQGWVSLRTICLGRKNYLFMGSAAGGKAASIAYTLIESARMNGLDPQAWLAEVLHRIPEQPSNRIDELPPWNCKPDSALSDSRSLNSQGRVRETLTDQAPPLAGWDLPDAFATGRSVCAPACIAPSTPCTRPAPPPTRRSAASALPKRASATGRGRSGPRGRPEAGPGRSLPRTPGDSARAHRVPCTRGAGGLVGPRGPSPAPKSRAGRAWPRAGPTGTARHWAGSATCTVPNLSTSTTAAALAPHRTASAGARSPASDGSRQTLPPPTRPGR